MTTVKEIETECVALAKRETVQNQKEQMLTAEF
jgi:hypothetical protein